VKKLISYVLFGEEKHWCNVPWVLVSNSAIYPEYHMRFYIHKDVIGHPKFQMLQEVSDQFPHVEIEVIEEGYQGTQLTTWRMRPLWEDDVEILLCRDLDHATNKMERKAVQYFMDHERFLIHGIRSYSLHSIPYLAGLCGFRVQGLKSRVLKNSPTFEHYMQWGKDNVEYCSDWRWGCDQALMKAFFSHRTFSDVSLDCPQYTARDKIAQYNPTTVLLSLYESISLPHCDQGCLNFSESVAPSFTGQPWNASTDYMKEMIKKADNGIGAIASKYI